ncbi:MAG TPA: cytochrome P450 [Thermomicrobiales bacterium]
MPRWIATTALEQGPIFRSRWPDGTEMVYLVGPEANRFVLHTGRAHFSHEQGWGPILGKLVGKGLLTSDGAEHAAARAALNPALSAAYMERYLPVMERIIAARTADWAVRGRIDLLAELRRIAFDIAMETLFGANGGPDVDRLRELYMALLYPYLRRLESPFAQPVLLALRARQRLRRMLIPLWPIRPYLLPEEEYSPDPDVVAEIRHRLLALIAARRASPDDDALGLFLRARDPAALPLTDEQLLGQLNTLLVASHETTTTLGAWLLYLLARHPGQLARVRDELDTQIGDAALTIEGLRSLRQLGRALNEAGRLHPPVGNGPRGVITECTFGGYRIPAGVRVRYSIAGCHWSPTIFANPERFDPDRFAPPREEDKRTPYALIPFGGGPRICPGANFAQLEIKALVAHVLRRYDLSLRFGKQPTQIYAPTLGTPIYGVPVRVRPRAR